MTQTRKWLIYLTCITMGIFSAGCYSVNAVHLSEPQMVAGNSLFAETMIDGRSVNYHKGDLDSLRISADTVSRFSKGYLISGTPLDSVRSIEAKTFDYPLTVICCGATAFAVWELGITGSLICALSNANSFSLYVLFSDPMGSPSSL